jgi:ribosomal protein S18 acetylase RimI-like enzyme
MTEIRHATPADAAALAALALETFVDAFGADNRPEDIADYTSEAFGEEQQRREIENPDIVTLLVDSIAYTQIRRTPDSPHGEVELARFYVHRAHHGRGVAQTLMDSVIDHARGMGAKSLWLGVWERNARAIAFYRKCGFVQCGTQPFLLGSDLQTDWVMRRTNL